MLQQSYQEAQTKIDDEIARKHEEKSATSKILGPSSLKKKNQPSLPAMIDPNPTTVMTVVESRNRMNPIKNERNLTEFEKKDAFLQQLQMQQMEKMNMSLSRENVLLGHSRSAGASFKCSSMSSSGPLAPLQFPPSRENSGISGSEADFLVRQIHSASSTQLSTVGRTIASSIPPVPSPRRPSLANDPPQSPSAVSTVSGLSVVDLQSKMGDALAAKIAAFEKQVAQLTANLQRREEELEKKDAKLRKVANELDALKKDHITDIEALKNKAINKILCLISLSSKFSFLCSMILKF